METPKKPTPTPPGGEAAGPLAGEAQRSLSPLSLLLEHVSAHSPAGMTNGANEIILLMITMVTSPAAAHPTGSPAEVLNPASDQHRHPSAQQGTVERAWSGFGAVRGVLEKPEEFWRCWRSFRGVGEVLEASECFGAVGNIAEILERFWRCWSGFWEDFGDFERCLRGFGDVEDVEGGLERFWRRWRDFGEFSGILEVSEGFWKC